MWRRLLRSTPKSCKQQPWAPLPTWDEVAISIRACHWDVGYCMQAYGRPDGSQKALPFNKENQQWLPHSSFPAKDKQRLAEPDPAPGFSERYHWREDQKLERERKVRRLRKEELSLPSMKRQRLNPHAKRQREKPQDSAVKPPRSQSDPGAKATKDEPENEAERRSLIRWARWRASGVPPGNIRSSASDIKERGGQDCVSAFQEQSSFWRPYAWWMWKEVSRRIKFKDPAQGLPSSGKRDDRPSSSPKEQSEEPVQRRREKERPSAATEAAKLRGRPVRLVDLVQGSNVLLKHRRSCILRQPVRPQCQVRPSHQL